MSKFVFALTYCSSPITKSQELKYYQIVNYHFFKSDNAKMLLLGAL